MLSSPFLLANAKAAAEALGDARYLNISVGPNAKAVAGANG